MSVMPWLSWRNQYHGSSLALEFNDRVLTFADLENLSLTIAANLIVFGVGDRGAILCENSIELVGLIHALVKLNSVSIHLNFRLSPLELDWQIKDAGANYLIYSASTAQLAQQLNIAPRILIDDLRSPTGLPTLSGNHSQNVLYTSGTTGKPKGVILNLSNHYGSAIASFKHLEISPQSDRWLNCLPMFHIGGLSILWRSVIWGIPMLLLPSFEVLSICQAIAQVTYISLVPTMLYRIIKHPDFLTYLRDWQTLRGILVGGAATSPELLDQCLKYQLPLMPTYGLTEAASQVATLLPRHLPRKAGSVGTALSCNQIRIVDLHNPKTELGAMEVGEILLRGENVTSGYISGVAIKDWFPTGDIGYLDDEGFLYVLNRRSDLIISGGENIYPAEVEAILVKHPHIQDACVVGIPDQEWGEIVTVAIQTNESNIKIESIKEFCLNAGLAKYKLPRALYRIDSMPTTISGKVSRQLVRDLIINLLS